MLPSEAWNPKLLIQALRMPVGRKVASHARFKECPTLTDGRRPTLFHTLARLAMSQGHGS